LKELTSRLHREKDISLLSTIIKNIGTEVKQALAFVKKMVEQQPDYSL